MYYFFTKDCPSQFAVPVLFTLVALFRDLLFVHLFLHAGSQSIWTYKENL